MPVLIDSTMALGLIAAAVLLIGIGAILHALFCDRARGRKRCPKCWYDMSRSPSLVCSECGHDGKREKGLLRTRRRWRRSAVAAILMMIIIAGMYGPKIHRDGVWQSLPTTVLLGLGVMGSSDDERPWMEELYGRLLRGQGSLARWQQHSIYRLAIEGLEARPMSVPRPEPTRLFGGTPLLGSLFVSPTAVGIIVAGLESGDLTRIGLMDDLARVAPVFIKLEAVRQDEESALIRLMIDAPFQAVKYRVASAPSVDWIPAMTHIVGWSRPEYTSVVIPHDNAPAGTHEITFDITVEYAPLGIYGAYGPEEYAPYDRFTKSVTITIPEWMRGGDAASETAD